jgi:carboxyl-terminal processing protease
MRLLVACRTAWLVTTLLALTTASVARSATPSSPSLSTSKPAASTPRDPDAVLQQALDLERQRNWQAAIDLYQDAQEQWPSRSEFSHRRRLCETHYKIVKRYQDQSFRKVLLRLPRDRALALHDELLEKIEAQYVDPVALEPLVRRGLDNLEVALRDPEFLATNASQNVPERVAWLREALKLRRARLAVGDRAAAQAAVIAACELAEKALGMGPAPVILEFVYGACDALDDYTSYLTPDKLDDLYAMIDGNFVGLGIELKLDAEGLRLVGVIRGGPAWEAGLKVRDLITHVGGNPVRGLSLDEAAGRLQGNEGTPVEITVVHPDGKTQGYRLNRRHVEVESVAQAKIADPALGVGYIQLTGFQKTSAEELDKAIATLRRQGMRSLVLDLRGNPGGLLNVAVEIAERFLDRGVIVSTRGRAPGQSQVYRASSRALWTMPLVVLIDHDSASASEILAGALSDHNRATLIGERTYGKGSVQSIFALRSAPAGLKLTTAKFYSPSNRPYNEQGVEPNVTVRIAAKPSSEGEKNGQASDDHSFASETFGDPNDDQVLHQAILHVRHRLNASR